MSEALRQLIVNKQAAFRADPSKARATFESRSGLIEGFETRAALRQHAITVDEPESLGGTDKGPNPVELILAALGTCQEITYRAYATALGIPLKNVSVKLEGDIDLRGFFAVDPSVRPGYHGIRGTVTLESNADDTTLQALREAVNAHCPVLDIIANPVPVDLGLEVVRSAGRAAAE
jgi:uncharacterized OsmC-like protein